MNKKECKEFMFSDEYVFNKQLEELDRQELIDKFLDYRKKAIQGLVIFGIFCSIIFVSYVLIENLHDEYEGDSVSVDFARRLAIELCEETGNGKYINAYTASYDNLMVVECGEGKILIPAGKG